MGLFASTLPKSGTHLLKFVLKGMGLARHHAGEMSIDELTAIPQGRFFIGHHAYSKPDADALDAAGVRMIALARDPRDFAVSLAHHRLRSEPGDLPSMLARLCLGEDSPFDQMLADFHGWQTEPRCLVLRFEDLIGAPGGGSEAAQLEAGRRLRDWLGSPFTDDHMLGVIQRAYRPDVGQFRRAEIGAWRDEMPEAIADFINRERAETLRKWGY